MNGKPFISFEDINDDLLKKWQEIADLIAKIMSVPAALIMKTENKYMEVFVSSKTDQNPYKPGDKEKWDGLYCETVIKTQKELVIPDATADPLWSNNPDIKLGMIAYLGYPINFPDRRPFGTLCVLDNKENEFSNIYRDILSKFRDAIESDISLLQEIIERKRAEKKLKETVEELKFMNNIMIDRELKMTELKQEINELLKESGKEPKY